MTSFSKINHLRILLNNDKHTRPHTKARRWFGFRTKEQERRKAFREGCLVSNDIYFTELVHLDPYVWQFKASKKAERLYEGLCGFDVLGGAYRYRTNPVLAARLIEDGKYVMGYLFATLYLNKIFQQRIYLWRIKAGKQRKFRAGFTWGLFTTFFYCFDKLGGKSIKLYFFINEKVLGSFRKYISAMNALYLFTFSHLLYLTPFFFLTRIEDLSETLYLLQDIALGNQDGHILRTIFYEKLERYIALHMYYDKEMRFFFWHFCISIPLPIAAFHYLWLYSNWFGERGSLELDRPLVLGDTWAEREFQTDFEDLYLFPIFGIGNAVFLAYGRIYFWGKISRVYAFVHKNLILKGMFAYGDGGGRKKGKDFIYGESQMRKHARRMQENKSNLLRPGGDDFVIFEPVGGQNAFLFPKTALKPSFIRANNPVLDKETRAWRDQGIRSDLRGSLTGDVESAMLARKRADVGDMSTHIDQASQVIMHRLYYLADRNNPFNVTAKIQYVNWRGIAWYPWFMRFGTGRKNGIYIPPTRFSREGYSHSSIVSNYGGAKCAINRDMTRMLDWFDVPIFVVIRAHAKFRRTCFEYNIPLDYTDGSSEQSLHKAFIDPKSGFHTFKDFGSIQEREYNYGFTDDPFLLAWLIAPPIRRHASYAIHEGRHLRPSYAPYEGYQPGIVSPANAVLDSNVDMMACYSNLVPFEYKP